MSKTNQLKDGVKPVENTRGAGQGAPASQSSAPESQSQSQTILSIIEKVKVTVEPKLWRLDVMPLDENGNDKIEILIGRVYTRDNTRTFPAVVLRLIRGGNVVRDYTISATPISYLLQYVLEFANSKKIHYLYDFASAFRTTSRTVNAEIEGGEIE
jgi:hypothetical protein